MMKWKVLISAPYMLPLPEGLRSRLEDEGVEITTMAMRERLDEAELFSVVEDFDGVICGDDPFTRRVLERASRLKVISKWGTGIDSIDLEAASQLGIRVCNTPGAFTDAVADTALGYLLSFARKIPHMNAEIKRGLWVKPDLISLAECTLGIVGVGNIGRGVAHRARAFGMRIFGCDTAEIPDSFVRETGIEMMSLGELLKNSDFVSLHCDLNPTSVHLVGRDQLDAMKSSAYVINTARGSVIDEAALVDALENRRIAGAALDVFEIEPLPASSRLRAFENCLLAPHNANSSPAARERVHESTIANLLRGLRQSQRGNEEPLENRESD